MIQQCAYGHSKHTYVNTVLDNGMADAEQNRRSLAISDTVVKADGRGFCDVAGLREAKQTLKEAIVMPLVYPHLFTGGCFKNTNIPQLVKVLEGSSYY